MFCKALTNAVSFRLPGDTNTLTFNPCCLYDEYVPFHPTIFKKERQKYLQAETFLPGCSKCELKEKTHNNSLRLRTNTLIPDNIGSTIYKLEIVLDTTCNAACIQCGDLQSSLWRQQIAEIKGQHIQPIQQIDSRIEQIKQFVDIQNVKNFHFWGGEPLLTDTHLKFINDIKDPSDVVLSYTTNGSIMPDDETLKRWEQFKLVRISVSLDGIGDQFHYIRWPLSWDKVARNIELFKKHMPGNVEFNINYCVIPLNVLYTKDLGDWLSENFNQNKNGNPIKYNFIRGEGTLDIANCPMSLREEVWKQLGDNHDISNVLKEVEVKDPSAMIYHLDFWDSKRKLNWRELFPEVAKHF